MPQDTQVEQDAPTNAPYVVACDNDGSGRPVQLVKLVQSTDNQRTPIGSGGNAELFVGAIGITSEGASPAPGIPPVIVGGIVEDGDAPATGYGSGTVGRNWIRSSGAVVASPETNQDETLPGIVNQSVATNTIAGPNPQRRRLVIVNSPDSDADMFVAFNSNPVSVTNYTYRIVPGATLIEEGEFVKTSMVAIAWEISGPGHASVTEFIA